MRTNEDDAPVRLFALTVSGLGTLASAEIAALPGARITGAGEDGRSDVVLFTAPPAVVRRVTELRTVEDVFIETGRTLRSEGDRAPWIARRLWRTGRVERAVRLRRPRERGGGATYRAVVRVLQERSFRRTDLRRAMESTITGPGWRPGDPAELEFWVLEYTRGAFVAGLRLSTAAMRQRGGRVEERTGALRPAVAAAMVWLAGDPPGRLLDPCCGSGTILAEAAAAGWAATGYDIDRSAVRSARRNVPDAAVATGDARRLDLGDGAIDACVSNLPFGRQYAISGDEEAGLRAVLAEVGRVLRPAGRAVLLAPALPRADLAAAGLSLRERHRMRLLGVRTTLWCAERRSSMSASPKRS